MITTTEIIGEKLTKLTIDFSDENVVLVGETEVVGDEGKTLAYAHFFEQDLRRNNAELFPQSETEMDGEMI
ncbi:MAG: hypothetical protein AB7S54_12200 [Bacteroidales bacterium]